MMKIGTKPNFNPKDTFLRVKYILSKYYKKETRTPDNY